MTTSHKSSAAVADLALASEMAAQSTFSTSDSFHQVGTGHTWQILQSLLVPVLLLMGKGCRVRPLHFAKIESSAGIASVALHWFYFCLTDHKQFVYIDSFSSFTVSHQ